MSPQKTKTKSVWAEILARLEGLEDQINHLQRPGGRKVDPEAWYTPEEIANLGILGKRTVVTSLIRRKILPAARSARGGLLRISGKDVLNTLEKLKK